MNQIEEEKKYWTFRVIQSLEFYKIHTVKRTRQDSIEKDWQREREKKIKS